MTKELFKQIYVKEGLQLPSPEAYPCAYISLWTQVQNPGFVVMSCEVVTWVACVFMGCRFMASSKYVFWLSFGECQC